MFASFWTSFITDLIRSSNCPRYLVPATISAKSKIKTFLSYLAIIIFCLGFNNSNAATINVAIDSSPAGLDPHLITAFNSVIIVQNNIYEGLTNIDSDLSVNPGLAKSWEVSSDGLKYTFNLHSNVTFHDGSKMDAEDVKASILRVQSKDMASPLASRVSPVKSIDVLDSNTICLLYTSPSPRDSWA